MIYNIKSTQINKDNLTNNLPHRDCVAMLKAFHELLGKGWKASDSSQTNGWRPLMLPLEQWVNHPHSIHVGRMQAYYMDKHLPRAGVDKIALL